MHSPHLIDLHDARLDAVLISPDAAILRFAHLVGYEKRKPDVYDVVSYDAELTVKTPSRLTVTSWIEADARVSAASFAGKQAFAVEDVAAVLSIGLGPGTLEVVFSNAAKLEIAGSKLFVVLGSRRVVLDEWRGPLISDPSRGLP